MASLYLKSPAKLNLFLRIMRRREDGYHELASLFQAIDLCDYLTVETASSSRLTCSDASIPIDQSNLISRAVALFQNKTGIKQSFKIDLQKQIPHAAGLGGGSSNAATTLWAVNQLSGNPVTIETLSKWGAEIGSDLSFFFSRGTAYCTGRGEKVNALAPLPRKKIQVIKPTAGLSTPLVYKQLRLECLEPRSPEFALAQILQGHENYFNDLELPAFELMPELAKLKKRLMSQGYSVVTMNGSGSSFFCTGEGEMKQEKGLKVFSASFINRSDDQWWF